VVKTIRVDEEVWELLMSIKIRKKYRNVNDVLREILGLNVLKTVEIKKESRQEKREERRLLFGLSRRL